MKEALQQKEFKQYKKVETCLDNNDLNGFIKAIIKICENVGIYFQKHSANQKGFLNDTDNLFTLEPVKDKTFESIKIALLCLMHQTDYGCVQVFTENTALEKLLPTKEEFDKYEISPDIQHAILKVKYDATKTG